MRAVTQNAKQPTREKTLNFPEISLYNLVQHSNADILPDHLALDELLAYVVGQPHNRKISSMLLSEFISLSGVFDAPFNSLLEVDGVDINTALFIKTMYGTMRSYICSAHSQSERIIDTESAKHFMLGRFYGLSCETVYIAGLGKNGRVLFSKKIAEGLPCRVDTSPRQVLREALIGNAVKIVLAHNHPHGDCTPSRIDIYSTQNIGRELQRFDIELFDHIIVGADGVYSVQEHGQLWWIP